MMERLRLSLFHVRLETDLSSLFIQITKKWILLALV